jgi:hypothetical protein
MAKSVAEILAAAKAINLDLKPQLLKEEKEDAFQFSRESIRYPRITRIYCVLAPVGYEWLRDTYDVYEGDGGIDEPNWDDTYTVVKHGHPVGNTCFAPNFCHIVGYAPVGNESPTFLRLWEMKWGKSE